MNYRKIGKNIIYVLLVLTIFLIIIFLIKKDNEKKDFWVKNECNISKPSSIVNRELVSNFSETLNFTKGVFIENFQVNNFSYKVAQYGCSSVVIKYFIPIDKKDITKSLTGFIYNNILNNLDNIKNVLSVDFVSSTVSILKSSKTLGKEMKYNRIIYPDCEVGLCNESVVILESVFLDGNYYIPIKYAFDL